MLNYVCKRLLGLIPTLLIVAVLVFLFVHMLPGDPARLVAGPEADATVIELVRKQLGLDQPLYMQFLHYIGNVLQGDFGISMVSRRPVSEEIASRFMPTFWLTIASMCWAVVFGLGAGIEKTATAMMTFAMPLPMIATTAIASRMPGKANSTSQIRMMMRSHQPS